MDDTPDPLEVLVDIGETERIDAESRFIAAEANVAIKALMSGRQAMADGDVLAGWMYVRLLAETAIRIRWLAGPAADTPDKDGAPSIDKSATIERIAGLRKRDYGLMRDAWRAVHNIRIDTGQEDTGSDLGDRLQALIDSIPENGAPNGIRQLAESTGRIGRQLYAEFRNSSSIIHPGSALGRVPIDAGNQASQLELASIVCAGYAAPIYNALEEQTGSSTSASTADEMRSPTG